jgi:hypothetical protein
MRAIGAVFQPELIELMKAVLDDVTAMLPEAKRTSTMKAEIASQILALFSRYLAGTPDGLRRPFRLARYRIEPRPILMTAGRVFPPPGGFSTGAFWTRPKAPFAIPHSARDYAKCYRRGRRGTWSFPPKRHHDRRARTRYRMHRRTGRRGCGNKTAALANSIWSAARRAPSAYKAMPKNSIQAHWLPASNSQKSSNARLRSARIIPPRSPQ